MQGDDCVAENAEWSAERPTRIRWVVFSLAFITSGVLYLHRYIFSFIKPVLAKEWNLDNQQLGQIDTAFALCYSAFQFPLAILADTLGVHLILSLLYVIWLGGLCLICIAPSQPWMWLAMSTLGTGQSAVYACLNKIGRQWYPLSIRTTLQGAVGILAGRLGALSSSVIFTSLLLGVLQLPWRTSVWILILMGIIPMLLFMIVFRNTPQVHRGVNAAERDLIEGRAESPHRTPDLKATNSLVAATPGDEEPSEPQLVQKPSVQPTFRQTMKSMSPRSLANLMFLSLQSTLSNIADNIYSNWIPLFLSQVHHLEFKQMGIYSAMPLLGGALAGLVGGGLNDFLIARTGNRHFARISVAVTGKGMAGVLLLAALNDWDRPHAFCTWLFFVKFFGDWSLSTTWGVVSDIGGRATASVFAFNNSVASLGLIIAPNLFGYLSENHSWKAVFITVAITYFLCALSWFAVDSRIPVLREDSDK